MIDARGPIAGDRSSGGKRMQFISPRHAGAPGIRHLRRLYNRDEIR